LTALNLSKNSLTTLPPELGALSRLKQLSVKDNPLSTPFK
jgi:Leucine-rich repeat (LRR) protein